MFKNDLYEIVVGVFPESFVHKNIPVGKWQWDYYCENSGALTVILEDGMTKTYHPASCGPISIRKSSEKETEGRCDVMALFSGIMNHCRLEIGHDGEHEY